MQPDAGAKEDNPAEVAPDIHANAPWRVSCVEVLPRFRLRVSFNDGTKGTVDMAEFVHSPIAGVFASLRDEAHFRQATVVLGAVTWPGGLDLAPDAMHRAIREHGVWIVT